MSRPIPSPPFEGGAEEEVPEVAGRPVADREPDRMAVTVSS